MSDITYKQDIEVGDYQAARGVTDPVAPMRQRNTRVLRISRAADAAAGTVTAETFGHSVPYDAIVTNIFLQALTGLALDAVNFFTLTVSKRDAAGANLLTVGTFALSGAALVAGTRVALTLTNANVILAAGGSLTFSIAKSGTGQLVPACDITVFALDQ